MLVNHLKLVLMILLFVALHVAILIVYKILKNKQNFFGRLAKYLFVMFTFALYLRTAIESYMVVTIAITNEIYIHDLSETSKRVSFAISIMAMVVLLCVLLVVFVVGRKSSKPDFDEDKSYFKEVVNGTKKRNCARHTVFILLVRIMFSVVWVINSASMSLILRVVGF
mmetsp:Transcript_42222/g.49080  ORF Transcript_42222/g.49080 Transcript_42222/m.49080 type:complete len:168 (-) Transcript_42222:541-1044(-)